MLYKKTITKSGFRIITAPMKNTSAVTLLLLVNTGSRYEKKGTEGLAHFLEHMVFKGTKNRPGLSQIGLEVDKIGGVNNAFTDKEIMGFWIKVDVKHFETALDIIADMVFNPLFKKERIDTERGTIFEEINMYFDTPREYVLDLWDTLLYGNQPLGKSVIGERKTLSTLSTKDFQDFLKNQFASENSLFCVAGGIKTKEATLKIEKAFKNFKKGFPQEKIKTQEVQKKPSSLLHYRKTDQTHFCLGVRTWDIFSEKKYILAVLSTILGGNMSSRLFISIRDKQGLAYYIRTMPRHYTDAGYLITHAGVDNKRVDVAIKTIVKEYKDLKTKLVSKEELQRAKDSIKGRLLLGLETSDTWTEYFAMQELLEGKILTPEEECKMIDKVTQNDILKVAKEIFVPERLNLAMIGPFKNKSQFEKILKI
jgi:predicted Zn-dependent peptidase